MRTLILCAVALIALVTGCGGDKQADEGTPTRGETPSPTATMPKTATFIADPFGRAPEPPMAMIVSVDGESVVAYACNGTDDAAWFFGTRRDGVMEMTSTYQDTLEASYDGSKLTGSVTMNLAGAEPQPFWARPVPEPAGIYTATTGDGRASWVVMPDSRTIGVMQPNYKTDREVIDQINREQADFKEKVREARLNRQIVQAPAMNMGTMTADINGTTMQVVRVTGSMKSPPNTN